MQSLGPSIQAPSSSRQESGQAPCPCPCFSRHPPLYVLGVLDAPPVCSVPFGTTHAFSPCPWPTPKVRILLRVTTPAPAPLLSNTSGLYLGCTFCYCPRQPQSSNFAKNTKRCQIPLPPAENLGLWIDFADCRTNSPPLPSRFSQSFDSLSAAAVQLCATTYRGAGVATFRC